MSENRIDTIRQIFAHSILLTRKWEVLVNRSYSEGEITLKQLMVLIIVENAFDHNPTIKELSGALTTSHQNVKAILVQLEKKGFVNIYTDAADRRIQRVDITLDDAEFWVDRNKKDSMILLDLFKGIPIEDLETTCRTIIQLDKFASEKLTF